MFFLKLRYNLHLLREVPNRNCVLNYVGIIKITYCGLYQIQNSIDAKFKVQTNIKAQIPYLVVRFKFPDYLLYINLILTNF